VPTAELSNAATVHLTAFIKGDCATVAYTVDRTAL